MANKTHKLGWNSGKIIDYGDGTAAYVPPGAGITAFRVRIGDVTGFSVEEIKVPGQKRLNVFGNGVMLGSANVTSIGGTAEKVERWFRAHPDFGRALASAAPVVVQGVSVADEVRKLAELRDQGVLTEEEYTAAKQRALGGPTH